MTNEGIYFTNEDPPTLARFRPKDEYVSTFDMLQDTARNQAYRKAVRLLATKPGDDLKRNNSDQTTEEVLRWLDIGTGSGLLASLVAAAAAASSSPTPTAITAASATTAAIAAADTRTTATPTATSTATAAQLSTAAPSNSTTTTAVTTSTEVYACEGVEEVADVAAKTFDKNGGGVRLFRGRSTEMEVGRDLPSRVPRVISELLGTGLLEEGILPTLRDAKARLLSPGYVSIPHSAEVWAFCCESSELHGMSRLLPSTAKSSGGGGGTFRPPSSENWERCPGTAAPASMHARFRPLSPCARIFNFDFSSHGHPLPGPEGRTCVVRFPIDATIGGGGGGGGGVVHAVVCWWRCFMDKDRTIVMSTSPLPPPKGSLEEDANPEEESAAPPFRDHWRQSVYMLSRPVKVGAGDAVRALACHDDSTIWFDGVEREDGSINSDQEDLAAAAVSGSPALQASDGRSGTASGAAIAAPVAPALHESAQVAEPAREATGVKRGRAGGEGHISTGKVIAREPKAGPFPPACVCGLHRTHPPSRIWMLNDQERTAAFRLAIKAVIQGNSGRDLVNRAEEHQKKHTATTGAPAAPAVKRRQNTAMCVACISDGFLLPLLAAQEGASEVLQLQPSAGYGAVCRDVYLANGIDVDIDGNGNGHRRVVRPFPGGVSSVYELLLPSPASASADSNGFGLTGKKLDAVIGEPFFAGLSTAAWPLESLLLFWCARTALEARGCFSPRTRVVPARARLLACPFACDLLFRGRRRVGTVESVDMSAVNHGLGCHGTLKRRLSIGGDSAEEEAGTWRPGDVESVRLSEFGHELLGPSTVVLDMDLTRPLCDLRGGRKEIRCCGGGGRQHHSTTEEARAAAAAQGTTAAPNNERGEGAGDVVCHGVALWLDVWLDEEGLHRLSTGPEVLYWPQGLVFFEEGWLVPPCGRSFHLEVALEDGALGVDVS